MMNSASTTRVKPDFDAIVVGAGFAGIYLVHRLRGLGLSVRLYEAGAGPGGTWYWNKYPGAASDIESLEYSYTFSDELQQEWSWSRRFAHQPEILAYMNHVVDRFDLRSSMQFDTKILSAHHDRDSQLWRLTTDLNEEVTSRYTIMAVGYMSTPKADEFPGLDRFNGQLHRTFGWPEHKVDFEGKRVGVIGTGPSGIQCIPVIAEQAGSLTVFQRTPNFSVSVRNGPMDPAYQERIKDEYHNVRRKERNSQCGIDIWLDPLKIPTTEVSDEEIEAEFEKRWEAGGLYMLTSYTDLLFDLKANAKAAEFVRRKIRAKINDPEVADLLVPKGYAFGSRRVCTDNNYFETFNRPNVNLVDVKSSPIVGIEERGVRTEKQLYELDMLILATGFDALTGALSKIDIRGLDGVSLNDRWDEGPITNFGMMTSGFPNFFMVDCAHHPFTSYNTVPGVEFQGEWVCDLIEYMRRNSFAAVATSTESENWYTAHLQEVGAKTLLADGDNWYNGANVKGKRRVLRSYYGGFQSYKNLVLDSVSKKYAGFEFQDL
jgi:cation diffusion facilitator CzcD-associated flavoprotein CzcO